MKNKTGISILLASNFISGIAQGISMIAVPLHFAKTAQTEWFAFAYTVVTIVTLFWAPYAGTLTDKYNRKTVFLVLMSVMAFLMTTVSVLTYSYGALNLWVFLAFGFTFWNYSLHYVCLYAIMQEMTEPAHYKRIASILEVQGQLASALAGAAAAIVLDPTVASYLGIKTWELYQIFSLDAFTYIIGIILILFLKYESLSNRNPEKGNVLMRLGSGFNFLISVPYIFIFGVFSQAVFVTVLLHVFELSPAYVQNFLNTPDGSESSVFAVSEILYSLGAVFAGISIQLLFRKSKALTAIVILTLITVVEFSLLIGVNSIILFLIVSLLLGITNAGIRVIRVSYLFKVIPNQYAGRANSIFGVSNTILRIIFLTIFTLPFFHEAKGIAYTFLVLNIFLLLSVLMLMFIRKKVV